MPTLSRSETDKIILEQVTVEEELQLYILFNFVRNKNYVHKISPRNSK